MAEIFTSSLTEYDRQEVRRPRVFGLTSHFPSVQTIDVAGRVNREGFVL